jgi:hypothetical protein
LRQLRRAKTARQLSAHLIRVAKDFEAYAVYVSNFATAISTLHAAAPRVQAALNECEANASAEVSFQNFHKGKWYLTNMAICQFSSRCRC